MDMDRPDEDVDQSTIDLISLEFNQQIDLQCNDEDHKEKEEDHNYDDDDDDDEEEDNDDDFTFMLIGHDEDPNYDDNVFEDGRIQPVFPLFDRNLLIDGEYHIEEIDRLPIHPPVDKIFIESPRGFPSTTHEENHEEASGPYCEWSKDSATAASAADLSKKSNSTGFSKLWRLREKVGRSNSDGRDAFVFIKSSDKSTEKLTTTATTSSSDRTFVKVNGRNARVIKQGPKVRKSTVSAHEAYLRSRGEHTEEERRRSYLPYRPEMMGLFTNVHGGLSKNVHPY